MHMFTKSLTWKIKPKFITNSEVLISLLVGSVSDNRDGIISITSSAINLVGTQSVEQISATGSYTMTLNISDLALNDLSGVNMSLTIIN